jgi:hypothetical protein
MCVFPFLNFECEFIAARGRCTANFFYKHSRTITTKGRIITIPVPREDGDWQTPGAESLRQMFPARRVSFHAPADRVGPVGSDLGPDGSGPVSPVRAFFPFPDHDSGGQTADLVFIFHSLLLGMYVVVH